MSNISIEQIVAWANDAHMVLSSADEYSEEYAAARAISELASELLAYRQASTQPVGEVVAWGTEIPERQGINRKVDFRWLDVNVEPGTLLYAAPQPDKAHK